MIDIRFIIDYAAHSNRNHHFLNEQHRIRDNFIDCHLNMNLICALLRQRRRFRFQVDRERKSDKTQFYLLQ